jgi:hypothetical protein
MKPTTIMAIVTGVQAGRIKEFVILKSLKRIGLPQWYSLT